MSERSYRLLPQEDVMYEGPSVTLTNHRLMANIGRSDDGSFDEALLTDIAAPQKYNGGKYTNKGSGARILVAGAVVLVFEFLFETAVGLNVVIALLLFLAGAVGATVGLYLIVGGLFQVKPSTTLVFPKTDGGQIIVPFTDWDSPTPRS